MKQALLIGFTAAAFATTLVAMQPSTARVLLETRVTRGAPYSAEAVSEFVQVLADGNRIVRRTTTRIARDSEGRTRRETVAASGAVEEVVITDPVSSSSLVLDPQNRIASRRPGSFAVVAGARGRGPEDTVISAKLNDTLKKLEAARGRGPEADAETHREDLGQQTIEGVTATGTRTTTVIPAGAVGNESPITIVSEQWHAPELQMLVLTRHNDPRVGETTYRVTNIIRIEPDASLFHAPADYTLRDDLIMRKKVPELPQ